MRVITAAVIAACLVASASAQDFPSRPVTVIVPFAAGGSTDLVARLTADGLSKALGQSVIVENVTGAGGTIASGKVAKARADGYTLLVHHVGLASAATLYRTLSYDTRTAFQPLGVLTHTASVFIARPDFPAKNFAELLDHVRRNGDKVTLGNAGLGAASHLCGMLFQSLLGVQVTTIPYRGNAPVLNDLRGKQIDMTCDQATAVTPHVKTGAIRAYAVTTKARIADLPDLPTVDEGGLKGFDLSVWHGLYAPRGLPQPVLDRLAAAVQATVRDPAFVEKLKSINTTAASKDEATPAGLTKQLLSEVDRWAPIIKAAGQYAD
jgi:tripartite-type tricarboxylate transporter receptor subunit TctC